MKTKFNVVVIHNVEAHDRLGDVYLERVELIKSFAFETDAESFVEAMIGAIEEGIQKETAIHGFQRQYEKEQRKTKKDVALINTILKKWNSMIQEIEEFKGNFSQNFFYLSAFSGYFYEKKDIRVEIRKQYTIN